MKRLSQTTPNSRTDTSTALATPPATPRGRLLSEREVEEEFAIKMKYLQKLRLFGRGPRYFKFSGRMVRYSRADIELWIESHAQGGGAR
jgi:predicted DNA-binding transcriptional regulator AlpA